MVQMELKENIAILTLTRPKVLNALNRDSLKALQKHLETLLDNEGVRGIIVTGYGEKAFATGADIAELHGLSYEDALAHGAFGQRLFDFIESYPKPIVAAVNGYALGAGCELAMACHLIVAAENAQFGLPELKLGIIPGYGGTQRLQQRIGKTRALEMILTGKFITAQQAYEWGLVNKIVPLQRLLPESIALLKAIIEKSPLAIRYAIEAINAFWDEERNGYEVELKNFALSCSSEDGKEGTAAFLQKRQPNFMGK